MKPWVAVLLLVAVGCAGEEPADPAGAAVERPDRVVQDFKLTETREGVLEWQLFADQALYYRSEGETRLENVRVVFFRVDGSVRSSLTSLTGRVLEESGDMIAEGNVLLVSDEGDTLQTEELRYRKLENVITGPDRVRIAKPDRILTGTGFRARPDLTEYEVERDVHIELIDRDGSIDIDG